MLLELGFCRGGLCRDIHRLAPCPHSRTQSPRPCRHPPSSPSSSSCCHRNLRRQSSMDPASSSFGRCILKMSRAMGVAVMCQVWARGLQETIVPPALLRPRTEAVAEGLRIVSSWGSWRRNTRLEVDTRISDLTGRTGRIRVRRWISGYIGTLSY